MSIHPHLPALLSRRPQRPVSLHRGCWLPLLRPVWPPARRCLCGSGHQHYLPVRGALIPRFIYSFGFTEGPPRTNQLNHQPSSDSVWLFLLLHVMLCVAGLMRRNTTTGRISQRNPARVWLTRWATCTTSWPQVLTTCSRTFTHSPHDKSTTVDETATLFLEHYYLEFSFILKIS